LPKTQPERAALPKINSIHFSYLECDLKAGPWPLTRVIRKIFKIDYTKSVGQHFMNQRLWGIFLVFAAQTQACPDLSGFFLRPADPEQNSEAVRKTVDNVLVDGVNLYRITTQFESGGSKFSEFFADGQDRKVTGTEWKGYDYKATCSSRFLKVSLEKNDPAGDIRMRLRFSLDRDGNLFEEISGGIEGRDPIDVEFTYLRQGS